MSSIKQLFLQQVDNFMNDLCLTFPKNGDILLLKEKYGIIKSANSTLILEYFVEYVYKHKSEIMNENENFFLSGGGQEEITHQSGLRFQQSMHTLWMNNMSQENKAIVWKYFKVFVLLIEKYILENIKK